MHTTMMTSMSMEGLGQLVPKKKCRSSLINTRRLREPDGHRRMKKKSPAHRLGQLREALKLPTPSPDEPQSHAIVVPARITK